MMVFIRCLLRGGTCNTRSAPKRRVMCSNDHRIRSLCGSLFFLWYRWRLECHGGAYEVNLCEYRLKRD